MALAHIIPSVLENVFYSELCVLENARLLKTIYATAQLKQLCISQPPSIPIVFPSKMLLYMCVCQRLSGESQSKKDVTYYLKKEARCYKQAAIILMETGGQTT